jgi:hypothetical protein
MLFHEQRIPLMLPRLLHAAGQMLRVLDEVVVEEQLMLMTDADGFASSRTVKQRQQREERDEQTGE